MKPTHFFIFCCALLLSQPGWAARWYSVEMIIFANRDDGHLQSEFWPTEVDTPDYTHTMNRLNIQTLNAQAFPSKPYSLLSGGRLKRYYKSLEESTRYQPLLYKSWVMPVQGKRKLETLYLEIPDRQILPAAFNGFQPSPSPAFAQNPPTLEGTLKITIGKFLHVYTDLLYRRDVKIPVETPNFDSPLNASTGQPQRFTTETQSYRVQAHRRMRSKKIHYIDHPALGVLIIFTRHRAQAKSRQSAVEVSNPIANLKKNADSNTPQEETPQEATQQPPPTNTIENEN